MKEFEVEVVETLIRIVTVEAMTEEDAIKFVKYDYTNAELVFNQGKVNEKTLKQYAPKRTEEGLIVGSDYTQLERFISSKLANTVEPSIEMVINKLIDLANEQSRINYTGVYAINEFAAKLMDYHRLASTVSPSKTAIRERRAGEIQNRKVEDALIKI